jgi:hypothetical protein
MMFWALVALAAAPLLMAAGMLLLLRKGAIHRLHEQRKRRKGQP